jgi:UDP-glucuronate 4-epimerase
VIGVDNFDPFYPRAVKERNLESLRSNRAFRLIEADVARDAVPMDGVGAVVHLAAKAGVRPSLEHPAAYVEANVTGTARVLDAARRAGVARVVLGSSSSVYGDATPAPFAEDAPAVEPISPYAATKRAAELLAHAFAQLYPMRIICLRFFTVYGPRQRPDLAIHRFTDLIARGQGVRMHGDGSSERDYTYISDAVDGVLAALTRTAGGGAFEVLNIGGGARVRLDRLIALIGAALGREPRIERHPDQPGDVRLTAADLRRAARALGYRPRVGIEEGIRNFVRWYGETHGRQS